MIVPLRDVWKNESVQSVQIRNSLFNMLSLRFLRGRQGEISERHLDVCIWAEDAGMSESPSRGS